MNTVLLTTRSNQFAQVFLTSYYKAGGLPFSLILFLPARKDINYPFWLKPIVGLRLFGGAGLQKILRIKMGKWTLNASDQAIGLGKTWEQVLPDVCDQWVDVPSVRKHIYLPMLKKLSLDVLVSCGSPIIFSDEILALPSVCSLNVHNGRVPMYRGHFASFWEVLNNEKFGHISIHEMLEKVDTGRVLVSEKVRIGEIKNFLELLIFKKNFGGKALAKLLLEIKNNGNSLPDRDYTSSKDRIAGKYFGWPSFGDIRKFRF